MHARTRQGVDGLANVRDDRLAGILVTGRATFISGYLWTCDQNSLCDRQNLEATRLFCYPGETAIAIAHFLLLALKLVLHIPGCCAL